MGNSSRVLQTLERHFSGLFPYHFVVDRQLQVISEGQVLARFLPERGGGENFHRRFEIQRPEAVRGFQDLVERQDLLFVVRHRAEGLVLRGQFLVSEDESYAVFLGSPWLVSSDDLVRFNLTLADFALCDPIVDLLSMAQAKDAAHGDIKKLADTLREKADLLGKVNDSLVRQNVELAEARDQAQNATRAKSEFLARMSHEIRTPMHGMLSMIEILESKSLDAESRDYLTVMRDSSASLLNIINDILDLSKIESGKFDLEEQVFSIPELIAEVYQLYFAQAQKKGLRLMVECEAASVSVLGDKGRLRQILNNLVSNSLKFTERGSVTIRAELRDGREMYFAVTDTGPGIAPEQQHLVFGSFNQLDGGHSRKQGGTGLGLAISQHLCQLMGGRIGFESKLGEGTRFFIQIPTRIEDSSTANGSSVLLADRSSESSKVLVVDDHPTNRRIIELLFKKNCVDFILADSGRRALDILAGTPVRIVLMDIQMPEMDGLETTRRIRQMSDPKLARLPVIAMTANALKGDREEFMSVGMQDYISKPFGEAEILAIIRKWGKVA